MKNESIKIDVVSDIACPWCYVGKHRLETAIEKWTGAPIEVTYHPFQLDPTIPAEGINRTQYLKKKFGTADLTPAMARINAAGKGEGITFNFGNEWLAVNTLPMHQLLHVAGQEGFKAELKERFFKAYFDENLQLNNTNVLASIMTEFDWDTEKTKQIISDQSIAKTVQQEIAHYQNRGVTGVPYFIINDQYGISGAQPAEILLDAFAKISETKVESILGESCDTQNGEC